MQKQQVTGLFVLLAVTAAVIGTVQLWTAEQVGASEREAIPLEENSRSPDGKYEVRQIDEGGDGEPAPSMETVQVVDRTTGEILWEDRDDYETSALWSPDGGYIALSKRKRTYSVVTVIETENFTSWQVPLPAKAWSAEYASLHADEWLDADTLRFQYQDMQASSEDFVQFYRCYLRLEEGQLTGSMLKETTEILSEDYDFDHDGEPETTELVTLLDWEESKGVVAWYELCIKKADGTALWSTSAHLAHLGWTSVFACKVDGQDCLLQYEPESWQGWAEYSYKLFYPDIVSLVTGERQEQILRESRLDFDNNFCMEGHLFDAAELADFLWEVRGYIIDSTLLLSTEDGEFLFNVPGLEMQSYPFGELLSLDSREEIEAALRFEEDTMKQEQGVA